AAALLPGIRDSDGSRTMSAIGLSMIPAATRNAGRPDGGELLAFGIWRSDFAAPLETPAASDFAPPRIRPKRGSGLRRTRSSGESASGFWRCGIRRSGRFKVG